MATQRRLPSRLAFGPFQVDAAAGELRKSGIRVRLPGQPLEILLALLTHPGVVVTREELRQQIWGDGTFVDFEHGLSAAMNKLRQALGDSAGNPRYIETVPGRGYRFIGSLQEENGLGLVSMALPQARSKPVEQVAKAGSRNKIWLIAAAAMVGIWMVLHWPAPRAELRVQPLTTNSAEDEVWHPLISPDGKYLAYADFAGIQVRLIATGELHLLPRPPVLTSADAWFPSAWFPDGTSILATSGH